MEVGTEAGGFRQGNQVHADWQWMAHNGAAWRLRSQPVHTRLRAIKPPPDSRCCRNEQNQPDTPAQFGCRLTLHRPS